jgi:hypothetical protein
VELDDLKQALDRLDRRFESQAAMSAASFRRETRDRVRDSLRPLARAQTWMIVTGVATAFAGVALWHGTRHDPGGLFASGIILHAYGVAMILFGAILKTLIGRTDAGGPVVVIQKRLARLRRVYVLAGVIVGLSWCVMWVPALIALFGLLFGIDIFAPAPAIWLWLGAGGVAAMLATWLVYRWARATGRNGIAGAFENAFTGEHLVRAQTELDEIARFERD